MALVGKRYSSNSINSGAVILTTKVLRDVTFMVPVVVNQKILIVVTCAVTRAHSGGTARRVLGSPL